MVFGEYVVGYLFLAGAGGGAFAIAAWSCMWDAWRQSDASRRLAASVQPGFFLAPCIIVLALVLLVLDLGRIDRMWQLLLSPFDSVMSVGAWLLALFLLVSGALAAAGVMCAEVPRRVMWPCCAAGIVLAIGVMGYTGVLLAGMVAVDFWHTPWLVALFLASALSCGAATIVCANALRPSTARLENLSGLWRVQLAIGLAEALVLAVFMVVQCGYTDISWESCRMMLIGSLAPQFWGGVVGAGFVVPWAAHALPSSPRQPAVLLIASVCVLIGGLALRYCIVGAAVYAPLVL